ncbi:MAG TPA: hypothetical protein VEK76_02630 [Candidatus Binatia bacterium]|nr:hypothetical protein [Candidatus Binatia bacterium]
MAGLHSTLRAARPALVLLALALAACGSSSTGPVATASASTSIVPSLVSSPAPGSPSASPTAPATGSAALSACESGAPASPQFPASGPPVAVVRDQTPEQIVELVDAQGDVLNQATTDVSSGPFPVGVGPDGVFLYHQDTGEMDLLGESGQPQDLGLTAPGQGDDPATSAAESPNGRCWILSLATWSGQGTEMSATTHLYIGIRGKAPTLAATFSRANTVSNGTWGGGFQVLRWDAAGVLLGSSPTDVGGAGPFIGEDYSLANVVRYDPGTGAVSSPLCALGNAARFADAATDGSVACVTGEGSDARITVTHTDGTQSTIDTEAPYAGQVAFVAGSSTLTFSTSFGSTEGGGAWTDTLWTATLSAPSALPQTLRSGDQASWDESGSAPQKLIGSSSIVELGAPSSSAPTSLVTIDLGSGKATTIGPADGILGVL